MNGKKIKRHYWNMRLGNQTLSPFLQFSNFMMLAYLTINEVIPIWIFAPLFILGILVLFTYVGAKFRKHQQPMDINLSYEKSTEAGKTVVSMMLADKAIMDKLGIPYPDGFEERLEYMKKIGDGLL